MAVHQYDPATTLPDKDTLEREKLRCEIQELNRPFYHYHNFWLGLATAIAALVGIVGQSYISQYESKISEYKNLKAQHEQQEAQSKRDEANRELSRKQAEINALTKTKQNLTAGLHNVVNAIAQTPVGSTSSVQRAVRVAENAAFTVEVYAHGVAPAVVDQVTTGIATAGYTLPASTLLPTRPSWLASEPAVLYYAASSAPQAQANRETPAGPHLATI